MDENGLAVDRDEMDAADEQVNGLSAQGMPDPIVEQWLNEMGVRWSYIPHIPLRWFVDRDDMSHQLRSLERPLNIETVEEYQTAIQAGARFPALVAYMRDDGRYGIVAGNHREAAAHRAGVNTFDAYIITEQDEGILALLAMTSNQMMGMRPPREVALEHARMLCQRFNLPATEAARRMCIPVTAVRDANRGDAARRRLEKHGVQAALPLPVLVEMAAVSNDHTLVAMAQLVAQTGIGRDQVRDLAREVRQEGTEQAQLQEVQRWAARPEMQHLAAQRRVRPEAARTPSMSRRLRFLKHLKDLQALAARRDSLVDLGITLPDEQAHVRELWRALVRKMEAILGRDD
jgi:hypothetical protein